MNVTTSSSPQLMEETCKPADYLAFPRTCADDLKMDMESLRQAVRNRDTEKMKMYLHRLASTFANCGYEEGMQLCNVKAESLLLDPPAVAYLRSHALRAAGQLDRLAAFRLLTA